MKKNSGDNLRTVQVDPINGEYYITIPEWMMNELSWYEDTEVQFNLEGNEIIISEKD
jgi:hypothetical protein